MAEAIAAASPAAQIPARLNLALLAGAAAASAGLLWTASHADHVVLVAAAAIVFSFTANTLFSLLHEAVHGMFSPHRAVNEWAGRFAAAFFPTGLTVQRAFHLTHHRNNRSPSEQFDIVHEGDVGWLKQAQWYSLLTGIYWLTAVFGVFAFLVVPRVLRLRLLRSGSSQVATQTSSNEYLEALEQIADKRLARLEVAGAFAFQAALYLLLDLSPLGFIACYAAFALAWSALQYADHAFSPLDRHEGAWNLEVSPITRAFFLNYHYHRAHHQNPTTPWSRLPALVDPAEPMPSYWRVWLEMWKGPRPEGAAPPLEKIFPPPPEQRFFGLPRGLDAGFAVFCNGVFLAAFGLFYGGASLLAAAIPWRFTVALPFEAAIPFVPEAAAIYLTVFPFLGLAPFILRRRDELLPLLSALVAATVIAAIFFLALPVWTSWPPREVAAGAAGTIFTVADTLNLEGNNLPSLHVALVLIAAIAYRKKAGRLGAALLFLWVAGIAAATLLIHEHQLADLAAGIILAVGCSRLAAPGPRSALFLRELEVELRCLREMARFGRRHRRYWLIALAILAASLPSWRQRRILRTGFSFLQLVDDLLDGDRPSPEEPLERVEAVVAAITSGRFGDDDLHQLAAAFADDLRRTGGEPALEQAIALIREMQKDRRRVLAGTPLPAAILSEHHRLTFRFSVDLMLIAAGAELRAADVPELIEAFGWCSVMRDLAADLEAGLTNIPQEVVEEARAEVAFTRLDHDTLVATAAVRRWMRQENARAGQMLAAADAKLALLGGRRGARLLRIFSRSIGDFARRRLPRRYPFLLQA